jgi:hypothetical protein
MSATAEKQLPPYLAAERIAALEHELARCRAAHDRRDGEMSDGGDWKTEYEIMCHAFEQLLRRADNAYTQRDEMRAANARRRQLAATRWTIDRGRWWSEVVRLRLERECLLSALAVALGVTETAAWRVARLELEAAGWSVSV